MMLHFLTDYRAITHHLFNESRKSSFKLMICRVGFELQYGPDFTNFVTDVQVPRNTYRAGFTAQSDINDWP